MMQRTCLLLLFTLFVLAACGGETAEPETAVSESEPIVTEVSTEEEPTTVAEPTTAAEPTATALPEPTATDVPTAEPVEAPTAEPTAEPIVEEQTAEPVEEVPNGRLFVIIPEESTASYSVGEEFFAQAVERLGVELGTTVTVGSTQEIEGELRLDLEQAFPLVQNHFVVNIRSLTSDQPRRDERLREQGLSSNRFPLAEFMATAIEGFPEAYTEGEEISFDLVGEMTLREQTNPMTFMVTAVLDGNRITGTATGTMLMTDYGFDPPSIGGFFTVEDEVLLTIEFVAEET